MYFLSTYFSCIQSTARDASSSSFAGQIMFIFHQNSTPQTCDGRMRQDKGTVAHSRSWLQSRIVANHLGTNNGNTGSTVQFPMNAHDIRFTKSNNDFTKNSINLPKTARSHINNHKHVQWQGLVYHTVCWCLVSVRIRQLWKTQA